MDDSLLMPDEPAAVERIAGISPLLIHCDHGGNLVPRRLNNLGLTCDALERHVGWDIGAGAVSRHLAKYMNASAVIARYSRLVIDVNRDAGDVEAIPEASDGIPVPENQNLRPVAVQQRADELFWPYHRAIDDELSRLKALGRMPVMLSVHSFTPALMRRDAQPRPWHCGVMFSSDTRFGDQLIAALRAVPGMIVGVNEPYSGVTHGYCMKIHGLEQGLPHAQIEIRQDLICTEVGQAWWADLLHALIKPILDRHT
jgi:predicted N-formylglutamate amidohydrolase